jgi:hypothetical protein
MSSRTSAQSSSKSRKLTQLNSTTEKKLLGYAALAGASGVGILALVQPVRAEVVFTPTHQIMTDRVPLPLDLNGDGIVDFKFEFVTSTTSGFHFSSAAMMSVYGVAQTNQIWVKKERASALPPGVELGPNGQFAAGNIKMGTAGFHYGAGSSYIGPWALRGGERKDRFVGLKFVIDGQIHFGWARLNVRIRPPWKHGVDAVLTGYAYETDVNTPIETGQTSGEEASGLQPSTLGRLALGAPGLVPWRRELEEEGQKSQP